MENSVIDYESIFKLDPYSLCKEEKESLLTQNIRELCKFHYKHCNEYKRILDALGVGSLESNCHTEPLGEVSNVESQQDFSSMAHAKQALAHTYKNDKNLDSIRMHPKPCTHPDLAQNLDSKNHTAHTSTTQNQKSKKES